VSASVVRRRSVRRGAVARRRRRNDADGNEMQMKMSDDEMDTKVEILATR